MDFVFKISEYNQDDLESQVSKALEKQTELNSRRSMPRLWRAIDCLDAVPKASKPVLERRAVRYKIYGVVLLALGIFLLVPGLAAPGKLLVPLISGAVCALLGLIYLLPRRKKPSRKFCDASAKLLDAAQTAEQLENEPVMVRFTQDGMMLPDGEVISYHSFSTIVETENIYLLTWKDRATVLQKRDLLGGTHEAFIRILEEKTNLKADYAH